MSKESRTNTSQQDKQKQQVHQSDKATEQVNIQSPLNGLAGGAISSAGGTIQAQADQLNDTRFSVTQRQAMASQIGQVGGNLLLQRVVARSRTNTAPAINSLNGNAGAIQRVVAANEEAVFTEFGNTHRNRDFNPDVIGEGVGAAGGIHRINGRAEGARPEDPPAVNEFRVKFHKLHSTKLHMEENYPDLYGQLVDDHGIDLPARVLEIAGEAKTHSKNHKKLVKDLATDTPINELTQQYEQALIALGIEAENLTNQLLEIIRDNAGDDLDIANVHASGTEIWRNRWHRTVMAVNTVLHNRWPVWKARLEEWTEERRDEGLGYMDRTQINGLDYIGSLAKGYKGPPKQSVRFTPERFDVDANLVAPPLAAYALMENDAIVDRGRIWSKYAGIPLVTDMEQDIQQHLVGAGLLDMGMAVDEPFEAVIDAEGVQNLAGAGGAADKKALSERDQELRDRIFWARHNDMDAYRNIAQDLEAQGFADRDDHDHVVLRDHNEEDQTYAYTPDELNQIEVILNHYGAH